MAGELHALASLAVFRLQSCKGVSGTGHSGAISEALCAVIFRWHTGKQKRDSLNRQSFRRRLRLAVSSRKCALPRNRVPADAGVGGDVRGRAGRLGCRWLTGQGGERREAPAAKWKRRLFIYFHFKQNYTSHFVGLLNLHSPLATMGRNYRILRIHLAHNLETIIPVLVPDKYNQSA